ncbi:MAG TPA: RGCVC family protein [Actinophytocola sp.]|nr:RGCVC family protein [Actinophytocola sp.]
MFHSGLGTRPAAGGGCARTVTASGHEDIPLRGVRPFRPTPRWAPRKSLAPAGDEAEMSAPTAIPEVSGHAPDNDAAGGCAVCPHPTTAHDRISARFCAATVVGKFSRGCVCPATGKAPGDTNA